ncbi:MAG: signal peptidase I [Candidatus Pacearchaeota archaeon]|nr:signal peptidase I [Candidatus Pacearchaeota archaeon]
MARGENKLKKFLRKFWEIVWKDDSFKGWLISLVFIFVVIKFVFFPLLNLATGTSLPLAIVESCSMYHSGNIFGNFDNWWERHDIKYSNLNIDKSEFEEFILKKGFAKGDIIFIIKARPEKLKIGDVIIFETNQKNPIIHRIIKITEKDGKYTFSTIGDNNDGQLSIETEISEDQLVGRAVLNLFPSVGWAKLVFFEHSRPQYDRGFCEETGK